MAEQFGFRWRVEVLIVVPCKPPEPPGIVEQEGENLSQTQQPI